MTSVDRTLADLEARMGAASRKAVQKAFRPSVPVARTKADVTTEAARQIIDAETEARNAATARLRAARLARQAETESAVEAAPPAPKKKRTRARA